MSALDKPFSIFWGTISFSFSPFLLVPLLVAGVLMQCLSISLDDNSDGSRNKKEFFFLFFFSGLCRGKAMVAYTKPQQMKKKANS